jgi:hypothetical protein
MDHPVNLSMAKAGYPRAILVGALDEKGQAWSGGNAPGDHSAGSYNFAWQRGVMVPTNSADGRSVFGTGTSFAAPIESARLVTMLARNRSGGGVGITQTLR